MENTVGKIAANVGTTNATNCVSEMDDFTLLKMCAEFGGKAKYWRQKFIGLLPEVNRRRLYEKKKCGSIFEFAYKFAGLSEKQVRLALNLEERFYDKPELYTALVNGDVSINKFTKITSVATKENAAELLEKTKILPCRSLETFARDLKNATTCDPGEIGDGLPKPLFDPKSLHVQKLEFEFSNEIVEELNQLNKQGQDMNKVMKEMLEMRKKEIQQKKEEISAEAEQTDSRYVQKKVKNILEEEYGKKCSAPGCNKAAQGIHHTLPFAVAHLHDPKFMVPLCKEHHQIAHLTNLKYAEKLKL